MSKRNTGGLRVLIAGSALQLFLGVIYVWSVFVNPVAAQFEWDIPAVKLTSSFMLSFFVLGILAGGKALVKYGTRAVAFAGCAALAVGMAATSFVPVGAGWIIYFTYGALGGFGVGMAYNAIITCGQMWFPDRRGMAAGVCVCAFGFSSVVFAPLVEWLISMFGPPATFRALAAAYIAASLALSGFIKEPEAGAAKSQASAALLSKRQYTTSEMLKTGRFYIVTLSLMFLTAAFIALNPSFKSIAADNGLSEAAGTLMIMFTGVSSSVGRLTVPAMSDKIGRENSAALISGAAALSAAAMIFLSGAAVFVPALVIAFCYGGASGLYPILTADHFGVKNAGANYGAVMIGFAASSLTFPIIIGLVVSFAAKLAILGVISLAGVAMALWLKRAVAE
jgi:OFA family oxalate/formate antiporter-like MFS transporter